MNGRGTQTPRLSTNEIMPQLSRVTVPARDKTSSPCQTSERENCPLHPPIHVQRSSGEQTGNRGAQRPGGGEIDQE